MTPRKNPAAVAVWTEHAEWHAHCMCPHMHVRGPTREDAIQNFRRSLSLALICNMAGSGDTFEFVDVDAAHAPVAPTPRNCNP